MSSSDRGRVGGRVAAAGQSGWVLLVVLIVAVAALIVALWALLSVPEAASVSATGQSVADPKSQACADFAVVSAAVSRQTHTVAEPGSAEAFIVDTNSRLAMSSGAAYLLSRLDPATPSDIAEPLRRFAANLQAISMYAQAGTAYSEPAEAGRLADAQSLSNQLTTACK